MTVIAARLQSYTMVCTYVYILTFLFSSIAMSSDSKERLQQPSDSGLGWVKPKSSNVSEEGEFEHGRGAGIKAYCGGTRM